MGIHCNVNFWRCLVCIVPTNGNAQVPGTPFLGIPRFHIPPNGYFLLSAWWLLDRHLTDNGLQVVRQCQNIRWHTVTGVLFCLKTFIDVISWILFLILKNSFPYFFGTSVCRVYQMMTWGKMAFFIFIAFFYFLWWEV